MRRAIISLLLLNFLGNCREAFAEEVKIPCNMINDLCFLTGTFNQLGNLDLILDTGSTYSVLDRSKTSEMNAAASGEVAIDGPSVNGENKALIFNDIEVKVGSMTFLHQTIIGLPTAYVSKDLGHQTDGFLGGNVFLNNVVTIDYLRQEVIFSDKVSEKISAYAAQADLSIKSNIPLVTAKIFLPDGKQVEGKFLVDSGQVGPDLIIMAPFVRSHPELLNYSMTTKKTISTSGGGHP